jgi:hypothetical protein
MLMTTAALCVGASLRIPSRISPQFGRTVNRLRSNLAIHARLAERLPGRAMTSCMRSGFPAPSEDIQLSSTLRVEGLNR